MEVELEQLPCWSMFDHKIMDQIATLPSRLELPLWPSNVPSSTNATLWMFIKCHTQTQCGNFGHWVIHLNPPAVPITPSMYTLETLIYELGMPNPIFCPDDVPVAKYLDIIGVFSNVLDQHLHLFFKAP
jgi:hypothetical protein